MIIMTEVSWGCLQRMQKNIQRQIKGISDLNSGDAKSRKSCEPHSPLGRTQRIHGKVGGDQEVMGRNCDLNKWVDQGVFIFKEMVSRHQDLEEHLRKRKWWCLVMGNIIMEM